MTDFARWFLVVRDMCTAFAHMHHTFVHIDAQHHIHAHIGEPNEAKRFSARLFRSRRFFGSEKMGSLRVWSFDTLDRKLWSIKKKLNHIVLRYYIRVLCI